MTEQIEDPILSKFVIMRFQVQEVNSLLSALNMPSQAPSLFLANFINAIQQQVNPQIDALKTNETLVSDANVTPVTEATA